MMRSTIGFLAGVMAFSVALGLSLPRVARAQAQGTITSLTPCDGQGNVTPSNPSVTFNAIANYGVDDGKTDKHTITLAINVVDKTGVVVCQASKGNAITTGQGYIGFILTCEDSNLPAGTYTVTATLTDLVNGAGPAKPLDTKTCTFTQNAQALPAQTYVNAQVLAFAQANVGKQVGDGQCTSLVTAAVAQAGGQPYSALGPTGLDADYVWGTLITKITPSGGWPAAVQAGDIIQFRNVQLTMQVVTVHPGGSTSTNTSTQSLLHHTAIVSSVSGNLINVLQQNVNGNLTDQPGTIWGENFTVPSTLPGGVSVTTTYTLNGGTMWVYRAYK